MQSLSGTTDLYRILGLLADEIGPRKAGTPAEAEAAAAVVFEAERRGARVTVEKFSFRDWRSLEGEASLELTEKSRLLLEGFLLPYSLPSASQNLSGTLVPTGLWALIPQRTVCERFVLTSSDGQTTAAVLIDPLGGLRSLPNVNPLNALPTMLISREDGVRLKSALAESPESKVTLAFPGSEEDLQISQNVIAEIGSGPRVLLVVAHLDTVDSVAGANDNAAGVAVALELLSWYGENPVEGYRLRVLFTGAEEPFLAGSRTIASDSIPSEGLDSFVGCLNLDMIAVGSEFLIRADPGSSWAVAGLPSAVAVADRTVSVRPIVPSSDHWAFHEAGIPSAQLTRSPDPHWHQPSDVSARISESDLVEAFVVATALITAQLTHDSAARNRGADDA